MSIDTSRGMRGLQCLAGALVMLLLAFGSFYLFGLIGLVLFSPAIGAFVAYWIVSSGIGLTVGLARAIGQAGTDPDQHDFYGIPIRARWHGAHCEVSADDVMSALDIPKASRRETLRRLAIASPGGVYQDSRQTWWVSESAVLDWLGRLTAQRNLQANRLRLWLERETFPALRKAKQRAS